MLAAIFVAAVEQLTGDDYSEAQQEAWASIAEDEEKFGRRLASELTLIATLQGSPVGFAAGPALAGLLIDGFGWSIPMVLGLSAGLSVLTAAVVA